MPAQLSHDRIQEACNQFPDIPPRAAVAAAWIVRFCTVPGPDGPIPFTLPPHLLEVIAGIYQGDPYTDRIIRRALVSMARKNGKTELGSAITMLHLAGPEAASGSQIIHAASSSKEQARIVFDGAVRMANDAPEALRRKFQTYENRLVYDINGVNNYVKTISTKPRTAQGLRPHLWVFDEIAEALDRKLYQALDFSQPAIIGGGLGVSIGTRSTDPRSLFTVLNQEIDALHAAGLGKDHYKRIWSADPTSKNLYSMEQLLAANPAVGYFVRMDDLQADLDKVLRSPAFEEEFRVYRLNIEAAGTARLIDPAKWAAAALPLEPRLDLWERMRGKDAIIATDLGNNKSLSALGVLWPDEMTFSGVNFMSTRMVKALSTLHGDIPYESYAKNDRLVLVPPSGTTGMDYGKVAEWVKLCYDMFNVISFRYDPYKHWHIWDLLRDDHGMSIDAKPLKNTIKEVRQGALTYGAAVDYFEDLMVGGDTPALRHDDDPVTNLAINACRLVTTSGVQQMRRPEKNAQYLPNDAAVCLLMTLINDGVNQRKKKTTAADVDEMWADMHEEPTRAADPEAEDEDDDPWIVQL